MSFYADFHIHSRYSRSTSPGLELPELARWAEIKGLGVIGSGDFTHPGWFRDLETCLADSASGLFLLKKDHRSVHFILSAEISLIYKKGDKVRKVHLLLLAPSLAKLSDSLPDGADLVNNLVRFGPRKEPVANSAQALPPVLALFSVRARRSLLGGGL